MRYRYPIAPTRFLPPRGDIAHFENHLCRIFALVCFNFIIQVSAFSLTEIRCNVRQEEPHLSTDGHVLSDAVQDEDFPYAVQKKNCIKQTECVGINDYENTHTYIYTNMTNSSKFGFRLIWKVSFQMCQRIATSNFTALQRRVSYAFNKPNKLTLQLCTTIVYSLYYHFIV